jgi:hypothetical protein
MSLCATRVILQNPKNTKNGKLSIFRKKFSQNHKIATMYFDEPQHHLYLGFTDGEVECFLPNFMQEGLPPAPRETSFDTESHNPEEPKTDLSQEIAKINEEIDIAIECKLGIQENGPIEDWFGEIYGTV